MLIRVVVGAADSGKSTLFKQLEHRYGQENCEVLSYINGDTVRTCTIDYAQDLLTVAGRIGAEFAHQNHVC